MPVDACSDRLVGLLVATSRRLLSDGRIAWSGCWYWSVSHQSEQRRALRLLVAGLFGQQRMTGSCGVCLARGLRLARPQFLFAAGTESLDAFGGGQVFRHGAAEFLDGLSDFGPDLAASVSGVAPCPNTADATSPGRIWVQTKIRMETAKSVTTPSPNRFAMSLSIE